MLIVPILILFKLPFYRRILNFNCRFFRLIFFLISLYAQTLIQRSKTTTIAPSSQPRSEQYEGAVLKKFGNMITNYNILAIRVKKLWRKGVKQFNDKRLEFLTTSLNRMISLYI